jgi:GDP-L-fucose synthase
MYKDARVLVAGGTGLIGTHLVRELVTRGAKVRSSFHSKQPVVLSQLVDHIAADFTNPDDCRKAVEGIDYVFLAAANTSGAAVMAGNPVAHITENVLINSQILEAAAMAGVKRFLVISSSSVYPPGDYAVKEEEAFDGDPHESYFGVGWMKRYLEKLAAFYYKRYGMGVAIVRPSNTYGPHDKFDPERSHVLPALIRRAVEGENPFQVWGDGRAVRDFIYVEDLARASVAALEKCADARPINVAGGRTVTIRDCVDLVLKLAGRQSTKVQYDPAKPSTIPFRSLSLERCRSILGPVAPTSLEEGLSRTIAWYRETSVTPRENGQCARRGR